MNMTATASGVPLSFGTICNCYNYPEPLLCCTRIRIRNRSRKQLFGHKSFCVEAANANSSAGGLAYDYDYDYEYDNDFDPELRSVLELATDSELYEIETILFGPSYLSPLLKSIPFSNTSTSDLDRSMIGVDLRLRQQFIAALEHRFFFLAADARSTLRGWRPSYRNVLLQIRKKFNIPCSTQLSTNDLELEIFLHLFHLDSTQESGDYPTLLDASHDGQATLQHGLTQWKLHSKVGAQDIPSILLKGGGVFTLAKIYQLGGQLAMINLESRAALLAAKQGFLGAASRYLGFRSMITLLGPVLWGTFLADLVIQMLGTDYARILRTIYALAQIRVIRTYRPHSEVTDE